jgi:mono/diheme cytochrome c family protein
MSGNDHAHGSVKQYTILIVILAVVTFVEWQALPGMIFYSEALDKSGVLKPLLIIMSAGKFFAVVFYYMHLRFDDAIFRRLFLGVLSLAFVCVMVVMAVLKALPGSAHDMGRVDLIRPVPPEIAAARAATKVERTGEQIYSLVCVACHQANGSGMVGETRLAANLSDPAIWAKGDENLIDNITNGVVGDIGAMPAQKGVLSETEIKNVYAYIKETYKK